MTDPITPPAETRPSQRQQEIVLSNINKIENIKEEIKKLNEMQESVYLNDSEYSEIKESQEQAKQKLKAAKYRISQENQELIERNVQIGELKSEIKEIKVALSGQLRLFQSESGQSFIDDFDGTRYKIVNSYKKTRE